MDMMCMHAGIAVQMNCQARRTSTTNYHWTRLVPTVVQSQNQEWLKLLIQTALHPGHVETHKPNPLLYLDH